MQKNMKHVAQNLPKAVYEDCVKEELEILKKAGEFGGKLCSKVTMEIIKDKSNSAFVKALGQMRQKYVLP